MKRFALSSVLVVAVPAAAALAAACTVTRYEDQVVTRDGGATSSGETPGTTTNPLEGLAPDWQAKAIAFLDVSTKSWLTSPPKVANIACAMSCHTTFAYSAMAAAALRPFGATAQADAARVKFEARVDEHVAGTATPMYGKNGDAKTKESFATEAVLNAAALSLDDLNAGKTLSAKSKTALDRMWAQQSADGSWAWLEFGLEPWETRNDWGTAMAGFVAGSVPAGTSSAQAAGTTKLIGYLKGRLKSMAFHDRVTVLWVSSKLPDLLTAEEKTAIVDELTAKQKEDGGFALGTWGKGDLAADASKSSDGYATALATLALCTSSAEGKSNAAALKSLSWLAKNQQENGSWPGQSVNSDTARAKGFMTDAATSYAVAAITTCAPDKK
ncbi:MAG: hypothetical protein JST00_27785 [Deltaproteobacteria bacterium]|nr:hypothetical protein [Deltaproteobacteria bacterium]